MSRLPNSPEVKLALVGVSRDCFPIDLARRRLSALTALCQEHGLDLSVCSTIIENEGDTLSALGEMQEFGCNAVVIYLSNFGPEGPLSILAQRFDGPVMVCGAAEESSEDLIEGRGDAYCGMLNAGVNFALRDVKVYVPEVPTALPEELVEGIAHFKRLARVLLGVRGAKVFSFGPRPQDFYACNAPLAQLYELGVEVMENSELDLLQAYQAVDERDPEVRPKVDEMTEELGKGNHYPELLDKLACFELALERFAQANLGSRQYALFANKCWPAFERAFEFVPCYVNSRLSSRGMPVACEVDLYGALSEYVCYLASESPATLLDLNNTVPADMLDGKTDLAGAQTEDLFMGFHCGNTPSCAMMDCSMKHQFIMRRLMEPDSPEPNITRGTLEGRLRPGPMTFFRLQGTIDGALASYVAQGHVLDIDPKSFGSIGVCAIPHFARFYRHALLGTFPHHGAVAFAHAGKTLFDAVRLLGVNDIRTPRPPDIVYPDENPFGR